MIQGNNAGKSLCAKCGNFEQVVVEMEVVFASPYGLGLSLSLRLCSIDTQSMGSALAGGAEK